MTLLQSLGRFGTLQMTGCRFLRTLMDMADSAHVSRASRNLQAQYSSIER
jgi:hypothetical protein